MTVTAPSADPRSTSEAVGLERAATPAPETLLRSLGFIELGVQTDHASGDVYRMLRHERSGVTVVSIENNDPMLRTEVVIPGIARDDSGIFHRIEHAVLEGCAAYPFKAAWRIIDKAYGEGMRSAVTTHYGTKFTATSYDLATLGAFTRFNVQSVFFPLMSRATYLAQSGTYVRDSKGVWSYRGVVYEEMKGFCATRDTVFRVGRDRLLHGDGDFGSFEGGEPGAMRGMTYERFLESHSRYFRPERAYFAIYGNMPFARRLEFVADQLSNLGLSTGSEHAPSRPDQPTRGPRRMEMTAPGSAGDAVELNVMWRTPILRDPVDATVLQLTMTALSDYATSPISDSVRAAAPGAFFVGAESRDAGAFQVLRFIVHLREGADAGAAEAAVSDALAKTARDGLPLESLEEAFSKRHYRDLEAAAVPNRGGAIVDSVVERVVCGELPLASEQSFSELTAEVFRRIADGEALVQKVADGSFTKNKDRAVLIVRSDPDFQRDRDRDEVAAITVEAQAFTDDEVEAFERDARAIDAETQRQDPPEIAVRYPRPDARPPLPHIIPVAPVTERLIEGVPVYFAPQPTAGLAHVKLHFDCSDLLPRDGGLLNVVANALNVHGTTGMGETAATTYTNRRSGGLIIEGAAYVSFDGSAHRGLTLGSKAAPHHYATMFELFATAIGSEIRYGGAFALASSIRVRSSSERSRLAAPQTVVREIGMELIRNLGDPFATCHDLHSLREGIRFRMDLANRAGRADGRDILDELERTRVTAFVRERLAVTIVGSPDVETALVPHLSRFISSLRTGTPAAVRAPSVGATPRFRGFDVASGTNYVGVGFNLSAMSNYRAALELMAVLGSRYLNVAVRDGGKAYGGAVHSTGYWRHLYAVSWQDPDPALTLRAVAGLGAFLAAVSDGDIESAKRTVIEGYFPRGTIVEQGMAEISNRRFGLPDDHINIRANLIRAVTPAEFRDAVAKFREMSRVPSIVVVGSADALTRVERMGIGLEREQFLP